MSVRFDANGKYLSRSSSLPSSLTAFTACGHAVILSDRGTGVTQTIWCFGGKKTVNDDALPVQLCYGDLGSVMAIESYDGTTGAGSNFASRPALNRPFFWYVRCNSSGANGVEAGWGYTDDTSAMVTQTVTLQTNAQTVYAANRTCYWSYRGSTFSPSNDAWVDSRNSFLQLHSAYLSTADLAALRYRQQISSWANNALYVRGEKDATTDQTGTANLTATGSPALEAGIPQFYQRRRNRRALRAA